MHGSGTSGEGDAEGPADEEGDIFSLRYQDALLRDRAVEAVLIEAREHISLIVVVRHIRSKTDRRNGTRKRFKDTWHGMRAAGARSLADTDPAADLGVCLGHIGGRALVMGQDMFYIRTFQPFPVKTQSRLSGQAKYMLYLMQPQHLQYNLRT